MYSTAQMTQWWTRTNTVTRAEAMWSSWEMPFRAQHLGMALRCLDPHIKRLYEVGCGSGPNLRLLQAHRPDLTLGGSDVCPIMATYASEHLGIPIDCVGIPATPAGSWDVILSCYALAYIKPEQARAFFLDLDMSTTQAIILLEPTRDRDIPNGLWTRGYHTSGAMFLPEWAHDYHDLIRDTDWEITWHWPVLPPLEMLNAVTVLERADRPRPIVPDAVEPPLSASPLGQPTVPGTITLYPE